MIKECGEKEKGERRFLLLFKLKELLYDIGNMAWVEGHILESENLELRHTVQDIVQDGNRDRVARILDKAHCIVTEALYPYTSRELYLNGGMTVRNAGMCLEYCLGCRMIFRRRR